MPLKKCPHCELNYLRPGEVICHVCAAEMKRRVPVTSEEPLLCSECGEEPAVPGQELCESCLAEQKRQADLELAADKLHEAELLEEDIVDVPDDESEE